MKKKKKKKKKKKRGRRGQHRWDGAVKRGDVRDVCKVGRSGRPRWCASGAATRRQETLATEHASDALGRGRGEGPHAEGLRRKPSRRVGGTGADDRVDECLGVCANAAALLDGERCEAVVRICSEHEVAMFADLLGR